MLLQALHELYDRLAADPQNEIAPPGYSPQKVVLKVLIRPTGELFEVQDCQITEAPRPRPRILIVPGGSKVSGAVTEKSVHRKVHLLRGETNFLLGFRVEASVPSDRGGEAHPHIVTTGMKFDAFRAFHLEIEHEIADPGFSAVCRFLESWVPEDSLDHTEWLNLPTGQGVFQLLGEPQFVHDRAKVRSWWDARAAQDGEGEVGQCLVTGRRAHIARLQPMIKGVAGAHSTGASLVGFNLDSFQSYGWTQSHNAPVSESAAFRYTTALSALLDGPIRDRHRLVLGEMTIAYWTDKPSLVEDIFAHFMSVGSAASAKAGSQDEALRLKLQGFLQALRRGAEAFGEVDDGAEKTRFYLVALSPNAKRLSVRFFYTSTLGSLLANLRKHFDDVRLERRGPAGKFQGDPEFVSLKELLDEACPRLGSFPDRDRIPPLLPGGLVRALLSGGAYPQVFYQSVMRRLSSGGAVGYATASAIKGVLVRNYRKGIPVSLDSTRTDPPYLLGRLFAAVEKTQRDALGGDLNRTVRDSFYGSASSAPATVFPRLLRTYQHHLAKLEGGLKINRERLVQSIVEPLSAFPTHLDLVEQGLFAIGYYHQLRDFYTPRTAIPDSTEEEA